MSNTFVVDSKGRSIIDKDPNATLDYSFDWSAWLTGVDDTIATALPVVSEDLTVEDFEVIGTVVTIWVSGGTVGNLATLTCRITTTNSPVRIEDRSVYLKIKER
jgi:hypothetical protein